MQPSQIVRDALYIAALTIAYSMVLGPDSTAITSLVTCLDDDDEEGEEMVLQFIHSCIDNHCINKSYKSWSILEFLEFVRSWMVRTPLGLTGGRLISSGRHA